MMDEELKKLEAELARLKPRQPSRRLEAGIAGELANPQSGSVAWWKPVLAAAATIALAAGAWSFFIPGQKVPKVAEVSPPSTVAVDTQNDLASARTSADRARRVFRPVKVQTALLGYRDDGIILTSRNRPVRSRSCQLLDYVELESLDGKRKIMVTKPRKEIVLARAHVL
ncbi:MAG: hypothetical protein QGH15_07405 [Kiritimatiellia bacterium]|jgi:hypothetical protein|nr:hypothetical protein [Kiritimatiellia bacterium]